MVVLLLNDNDDDAADDDDGGGRSDGVKGEMRQSHQLGHSAQPRGCQQGSPR